MCQDGYESSLGLPSRGCCALATFGSRDFQGKAAAPCSAQGWWPWTQCSVMTSWPWERERVGGILLADAETICFGDPPCFFFAQHCVNLEQKDASRLVDELQDLVSPAVPYPPTPAPGEITILSMKFYLGILPVGSDVCLLLRTVCVGNVFVWTLYESHLELRQFCLLVCEYVFHLYNGILVVFCKMGYAFFFSLEKFKLETMIKERIFNFS